MENKKLIYVFGLLFSCIFATFYIFIFQTFLTTSQTVYYNQVGLYKNDENSTKAIATLKEQGIEAFAISQKDHIAVACHFTQDETQIKQAQETLKAKNIAYVEKQYKTSDTKILEALRNKDYPTIVEWLQNENQTDESTGTSS